MIRCARIAVLPVELNSGTHQVSVANRIDGTHLAANISARDIGYWQLTSPRQRSIGAGMGIGGAVGAIGGLIVGGAAGAAVPNSDVPDQWEYQQECHYYDDYDYCW
ncbi:hypothetical protein [Nocardia alni]|uniref:hypothetical protein n=1 Tax=Nocardia alni TaxID=2815723 RepID=UPI001C245F0B|nr:hypothetical protein [Nocardia alni]